jgi:hypothetical protein
MDIFEESIKLTLLIEDEDKEGYYQQTIIIKFSEIGEIQEAINEVTKEPIEEWCMLFRKGVEQGNLCLIPFKVMHILFNAKTQQDVKRYYLANLN